MNLTLIVGIAYLTGVVIYAAMITAVIRWPEELGLPRDLYFLYFSLWVDPVLSAGLLAFAVALWPATLVLYFRERP
jgi:hypothetical protein